LYAPAGVTMLELRGGHTHALRVPHVVALVMNRHWRTHVSPAADRTHCGAAAQWAALPIMLHPGPQVSLDTSHMHSPSASQGV
jgi:hypothetical protein